MQKSTQIGQQRRHVQCEQRSESEPEPGKRQAPEASTSSSSTAAAVEGTRQPDGDEIERLWLAELGEGDYEDEETEI
jgi:hypothetical protein